MTSSTPFHREGQGGGEGRGGKATALGWPDRKAGSDRGTLAGGTEEAFISQARLALVVVAGDDGRHTGDWL